ncbi:MAG: hypothetical protein KBT88_03235 [Gammaproteobacteria bacterium]|nr:hypothetical protein [Gammaproteobacteria bacterium]MBQ0838773.1 hypothetical protein [Gammaproteobacteria bacterium]
MKVDTIFYLSDSQIKVYRYGAGAITTDVVFDLQEVDVLSHFSSWLKPFKTNNAYLLLDLSSENYYEEHLPHVRGRDRKLLLSRKVAKYFPVHGYAFAEHARRLPTGRRDDVYFISGVDDASAIAPVIDVLADRHIEIRGVYSLPQFAAELVQAIEHSEKLLIVSGEEFDAVTGRYTFRQTFVDNEKVYFSRTTSIAAEEKGVAELAEGLRKEIERTWQYLNNRRALVADTRMQVLLVLPAAVTGLLRTEPAASNCDYIYADTTELAQYHAFKSKVDEPNYTTLSAFLLARKGRRKAHYQPERLSYFNKHQKIKQLLNLACFVVAVLAISFTAMNIKQGLDLASEARALVVKSQQLDFELQAQRDAFQYQGPAPDEMQQVVLLSQRILAQSALPDYVFTTIGSSFSSFNDLLLTGLEWQVQTDDVQGGMADAMGSPPQREDASVKTVLKLAGEVRNFDGNFRRSIDRIEQLMARLEAQNNVQSVIATSLPLDLDPSRKSSRALTDARTPSFTLEVILRQEVL